jgi:hypothetical protein
MFTLVLSRSAYFRVSKGVTACDIENNFSCPVRVKADEGRIVPLPKTPYKLYRVEAGDSYLKLAEKFKVNAEELKKINGDKPLYPTCRIYIP